MESTSSFDNDGTDQILQQDNEEGTHEPKDKSRRRVKKEYRNNSQKTEKNSEDQYDGEAHRPLQSAKSRHDKFPIQENLIQPFINSILEQKESLDHVSNCFRDQMPELRSPAQPISGRANSYLQILRLHIGGWRKRSIPAPA